MLGEEDAERHAGALQGNEVRISTVSLVEAGIVVESRHADAARDLQIVVESSIDEVVAVDRHYAAAAIAAWRRFGKGRHPASLDFGDCFAYALAHLDGLPLLYKGDDFTQTDLEAVLS